MLEILSLLVSYLFGSISFSFIFGKLKKIDLRKKGTKNLGATNAWLVLGPKIGVITGILDILKGTLAVIIAVLFNLTELFVYLSGISAIIGHIFPFYLNFKGGKGMSTSFGVVVGLLLFYKRFDYTLYIIILLLVYIIFMLICRIIIYKKEKR